MTCYVFILCIIIKISQNEVNLEDKLVELKEEKSIEQKIIDFNEAREIGSKKLQDQQKIFRQFGMHSQLNDRNSLNSAEEKRDGIIGFKTGHFYADLAVLIGNIEGTELEDQKGVEAKDHLIFSENGKVYIGSISHITGFPDEPVFDTWEKGAQAAARIAAKNKFIGVLDETGYIDNTHYDRAYTKPNDIQTTYTNN